MDNTELLFKMMSLDRINKSQNNMITTPPHIAEDMINILPDDVWVSSTKFLDPVCKSGIFLHKIYNKLMESESLIAEFPDELERRNHILQKQIYGIALDRACQLFTIRTVYGTLNTANNIKLAESLKVNAIQNVIEKEFKGMQFEVVTGNPPYQRGGDIDFTFLGYKISNKYLCMITPAKWQTAEYSQKITSDHSYGEFRKEIVPYIRQVCFYPCCKDVFDIYQTDGISYFLVDKTKRYDKALVKNKCRDIKIFNGEVNRSILNEESLLNIGQEIIDSLGNYQAFKFPYITGNKRYEIWMNTKVSGYDWYATETPRYVLSISRIIDNSKHESYDGEAKCVFESDSLDECKSFMSWIYSRFTRFFLVPNISKLNNIQTDHCFRFVPAPLSGKFDHIYTDAELYKAFNLPQKYIDVIETVVKERK